MFATCGVGGSPGDVNWRGRRGRKVGKAGKAAGRGPFSAGSQWRGEEGMGVPPVLTEVLSLGMIITGRRGKPEPLSQSNTWAFSPALTSRTAGGDKHAASALETR